jgi:tetratricopeptide (TPR) repeat protein
VAHYNLGEVEDAHNRYKRAQGIDKKIQNKDIETRYEQFKRGGSTSPTGKEVTFEGNRNDTLDKWYNEAVDLQNAKKIPQAEALYRKILDRDPAYGLAWNNLGAILGARGDLDEAEAAYLKALEANPAPETFANLANIYIALEDYGKAHAIISRGLEQNPKNPMLMRLEQKVKGK